ncbi:NAD(P)-dependent oxidoreductase [Hyphomicrobium methylovorum]|uniref:SDR family NAD(P)-dependent oxidoreductase n=1 Tax=Hyphomicrobium methylovorum TaxID=84 RepID=UPI0015E7E4AC|nr:SDR family NAD(P)-dependent oxidoreductase [Hyphomicrobium methylovorum]MBA2126318.1 NAD(P)-dependent oxidoreductase [Hyphomicrobium methylovorum]
MKNERTGWISRLRLWLSGANPETVKTARAAVAHQKPAVVITGGSRGIGFALAKRFLRAGHETVIAARSAPQLDEAAAELKRETGNEPHILLCDVTEPTAYDLITAELEKRGLYLDVLVNNAGVGLAGPFLSRSQTELSAVVATNIESVTRLTRSALPAMVARRSGGIISVASLGAYTPGPNQAAYYASKSYVLSLTEAIASEVAGTGVRVCVLIPGSVNTGFHRDMGADRSLYRMIIPAMSADRVAGSAYRGFRWGQRVIVPGLFNIVALIALKVVPHIITVPIVYALLKRNLPPR